MFDFSNANPLKEIADLMGTLLWGVTGGLANLFVSGRRPTFRALISCFVVSGFAAMMAGSLIDMGNYSQNFHNFVVGMAGFGGPTTLFLLYRKLARNVFGATEEDIDAADGKKRREDSDC